MIAKSREIKETRGLLSLLPTIKLPSPNYIFLATENARAKQTEIFVKEGDRVLLGQVVGMRHGGYFDQPIHSSVSGTYVGLEKHYHRSGKLVDFIKIKNDFKDELDPSIKDRTDEEIAKLTRQDFAKILKDTALVGLGGSSFPTYIKLSTDKKIDTILINAIECEPFISADKRLMMEDSEEVIAGIKLLMMAFDCHNAKICIKRKHRELISLYKELLRRYPDSGISVCPVGNFYPQGWEVAMIKSATGIQVETGHLPAEYGIANFNVSTVAGVYESVKHNCPVYERLVSVGGDGINYPSNFRVRIGTPAKELIEACGGYKNPEKEKVFILGGPMMGASLPSDDCILTKTVTSIIVKDKQEEDENPCIRCGSCVLSCPVNLEPVSIMNAVKAVDKEGIKKLNPGKCIECGLCSYVCTSHIRVTDYVKRAKMLAKLK